MAFYILLEPELMDLYLGIVLKYKSRFGEEAALDEEGEAFPRYPKLTFVG